MIPTTIPLPILFLLLVAVCFAVMLLFTGPSRDSQRVQTRIGSIRALTRTSGTTDPELDLEDRQQNSFAATMAAGLQRMPMSTALAKLLAQSHSRLSLNGFLLVSLCSGACTALLCAVAVPAMIALFPAAAVGIVLPTLWFRQKRKRRLAAFERGLPDAIDLMVRALRAGHSVQQMLDVVAEQTRPPLTGEFEQEQRLGVPFRDAMLALSRRVPSKDLRFVVTAILVQKETGGDLTEILDRTCFVIRERLRVLGEIRTHTAQGRLSGWVLSLLPVGLLACITLLTPSYATILFQDPTGQKMLEVGMVMLVLGGLVIRKIVDVEV